MVTPLFRVYGKRILFIPKAGEVVTVAPVIFQVRVVMSPSGSDMVAANPLIKALQTPGSVIDVIFAGQMTVGGAAR